MPRLSRSGVQVDGLRTVVRDLERAGVEVADLKDAFTQIGQEVAEEAQQRLSDAHAIRTGKSLKSIRPAKAKNKAVVRAGSSAVWWTALVDRNKQGHRGAGFLTIPANSHLDQRVHTLTTALEELLERLNLNGDTP